MIRKRIFQIISIFIEIFICQLDRFVPRNKSKAPYEKRIIIVRLDAIGDYILFRNAFSHIKNSSKFRNHKITVIGNVAWKNLSENFDNLVIDKFIWIKPRLLWEKPLYRASILKSLSSINAEVIFNPTYSRLFNHDCLVKFIKAKQKIGIDGDNRNQFKWLFKITNSYYSELISIDKSINFEFFKNSEILRQFLKIEKFRPELSFPIQKTKRKPENSVIIFPDAASPYRQWSPKYFAQCIHFLHQRFKIQIVILGNNPKIASELIAELNHIDRVVNLTGKTTLAEVVKLINEAKLLLSNDTGVVHIAAALNTSVICISNGNHYMRFVPYPKELIHKYRNGSTININSISPDEVINELENMIVAYSIFEAKES